ncbi:MAG: radical SAM protein [Candidatus Rokuibacteriota bacterium]
MKQSLTLIVKGTRLCNLRCSYCHDWRAGPNQTMRFEVLARMTATALRDPTHASVHFIWHGGETTVLPISFYEKALLVQSQFRREGQRVVNSIQTNATRLTPEWTSFFKRYGFAVGVSIDGPPDIHDRERTYVDGRPSWADTMRGIRLLEAQGISFSVLMVVDEAALDLGAQRLFEFFIDSGIKRFGLLSARPTNQPDAPPNTATEHYVSPPRMSRFLMDMYACWERHGDPEVEIRELDHIRKRLHNSPEMPCTLTGGCIGTFFLIEPNGEIAHCDLFLGDPRYTLGNVMASSFAEIRQSARMRTLVSQNEEVLARLRRCPEFGVCNGWCPHDRYLSVRHNPGHREECCGLSDLIRFLRSRSRDRMRGVEPVPR